MGATIIDALDTLYIMGMHDEFKQAREWIEQSLDFSQVVGYISVFETNIRYVGGLLSAYALTGDSMFLDKAKAIADKLMPAFKSYTGVPYSYVSMKHSQARRSGSTFLAEFGTLHMEFAYLSDITGDSQYREAVENLRAAIRRAKRPNTLYPNSFNPQTGTWSSKDTSVGALGDSFYEYLLKEWLRSGKADTISKEMFDSAALGIEAHLVKKSVSGLTYLADWKNGKTVDRMWHLACFAGGMYGLAAHTGVLEMKGWTGKQGVLKYFLILHNLTTITASSLLVIILRGCANVSRELSAPRRWPLLAFIAISRPKIENIESIKPLHYFVKRVGYQ